MKRLISALVLVACGAVSGPTQSSSTFVSNSYVVERVNNVPVPYILATDGTNNVIMVADTIYFTAATVRHVYWIRTQVGADDKTEKYEDTATFSDEVRADAIVRRIVLDSSNNVAFMVLTKERLFFNFGAYFVEYRRI
jgi:hypothetical protein